MRWILTAALAAAAGLTAAGAHAQELKLVGLDGRAAVVAAADIAAMPHVTLTVTVEGKTNTYKGVPLAALLGRVNAPLGQALRGQELRDVVVVSGKDGYAAVIALAEADPFERKQQIILADGVDGGPLPSTQAPYRLVVEGDQRGARLVRMVATIELRRLAPTP
ncbi:MAG TPA: molybdopterin-dependent oxidoreductase [Caulobacteraceae bacterium]|nr:molybdopterin-dependent oxidoreductase [Caulobacteraceae bacterium]